MKKILYGVTILITLFIFKQNLFAANFNVVLDGVDTFDNQITIDLKINNLVGFENGLYGLSGYLNYDSEKLELISINGLSNFSLTYDGTKSKKIVLYTDIGAKAGDAILKMQFINKALEKNEKTTIEITKLVASDGETEFAGSSISKEIKSNLTAYLKGDMNKNGKIDFSDVIIALRKFLNIEELTILDLTIADMNNNNKLEFNDVISILRIFLGIE